MKLVHQKLKGSDKETNDWFVYSLSLKVTNVDILDDESHAFWIWAQLQYAYNIHSTASLVPKYHSLN